MNWFDILKEQTSVQSSRSGMAPIDIQKPFKRVKEEDCYKKLLEYISSHAKSDGFIEERENHYSIGKNETGPFSGYLYKPDYMKAENYADLDDKYYCSILQTFKKFIENIDEHNNDGLPFQTNIGDVSIRTKKLWGEPRENPTTIGFIAYDTSRGFVILNVLVIPDELV